MRPTAIVALLAVVAVPAQRGRVSAQAREATFEVASVRQNSAGFTAPQSVRPQGDRLTITNMPLSSIIQMAHGVATERLLNVPGWAASERFDVTAKAEQPFSSANPWQPMLRQLLIERFKLVAHLEKRESDVYSLVVARDDGALGSGLRRAAVDCPIQRASAAPDADPCGLMTIARAQLTGHLRVRGMSIAQLAAVLSRDVRSTIEDQTGLTGVYDWELIWRPLVFGTGPVDRDRFRELDPDAPDVFTAVREQLGLRLERRRGSVDVVVVDSIERPSAN